MFIPPTLRERADLCGALTNARIAEGTGTEYRLPDRLVPVAANYLAFLVTETNDGLLPHIRLLERLYGGKFYPPLGRRGAPPGAELPPPARRTFWQSESLADPQALALAESGPAALRGAALFPRGENVSLVRLLLNPVALWALADFIACEPPQFWLAVLEDYGRWLAAECKRDLATKPATARKLRPELVMALTADGPRVQPVRCVGPDGAVAQMTLAERAYGDPDAGFLLRLHRKGEFQVELEMIPAPRQTVTLAARFADGEDRTFTIDVPAEARTAAPEDAPPLARSTPCEPLPADAFPFRDAVAIAVEKSIVLLVRSVK